MKFSLIIGTLNRSNELKYCLESLMNQTYKNYEIIIIDQSDNDDTKLLVNSLNNNQIIYRKVNYKGLSKARNDALSISTGDYFCLIDDDAYYSPDYLETFLNRVNIEKNIYSGFIWDTIKNDKFCNYNSLNHEKKLSVRQIIRYCPSAALAIPMSIYKQCNGFDVEFGVGGKFGAAEETDLLLRALRKGYNVVYLDNAKLKHPYPIVANRVEDNEQLIRKARSYYRGFGALYKKHLFCYKNLSLVSCFIENSVKLLLKQVLFRSHKKRIAQAQLDGFIEGFKEFKGGK